MAQDTEQPQEGAEPNPLFTAAPEDAIKALQELRKRPELAAEVFQAMEGEQAGALHAVFSVYGDLAKSASSLQSLQEQIEQIAEQDAAAEAHFERRKARLDAVRCRLDALNARMLTTTRRQEQEIAGLRQVLEEQTVGEEASCFLCERRDCTKRDPLPKSPELAAIRAEWESINAEIDSIQADLAESETSIAGLRAEQEQLRTQTEALRAELQAGKTAQETLQSRFPTLPLPSLDWNKLAEHSPEVVLALRELFASWAANPPEGLPEPLRQMCDLLRKLVGGDAEKLAEALRTFMPIPDRRPRARRGPDKIPQPTFPEAAAQMRALADGPSERNYEDMEAEEALLHRTPGHKVVTKVTPGHLLDWFHRPATKDALRQELREAGGKAAFQLAVVVGWGLQDKKSLIRRPLDDIAMTVKGRRAKSLAERLAWRQEVWRYLLLGESLTNPESRPGKFKDLATGEVIDTLSREAIYRVFGEEWPAQRALDNSTPPLTVTVGLNPDIDNLVNRADMLTSFGDVMRLAPIPDGQTSGRWARAMGLALNQLFRQRQRLAHVKRQGEDNLPAVPFTFTRKEVLVYVAAEVEALLAGNNPSRAHEYWDAAIDWLLPPKSTRDKKRAGVLAVAPREVTPLPGGRKTWEEWRQDWQDFWYEEQRLEFRPGAEGVKALLAMKASSKRRRK